MAKHRPKIPMGKRAAIYVRDQWTCQYCGRVFVPEPENLTGRYAPWHRLPGDPDYLEHEHPGFYPPLDQIRDELAGKNLACWCPEDQPCHGDTLLKIANGQAL